MTDPAQTLWLQTFLALIGLCVGLMLHLKWHPLREPLSDAWDMLQSFSWLVPMMAALQLMSGTLEPWAIPYEVGENENVTAWQQMREIMPVAGQDVAALTHGFFPPWPVALALPVVFSLLVWRVKRFPYRYYSRRRRPGTLWAWMVLVFLAWGWLGLEAVGWVRPMSEWLETLRVGFRWLAEACMMAGLQVYMVRLVMGWEDPVEPDDQKDLWLALEHTLSRWRGILLLASLDLLWLMAWRALEGAHPWFSEWLVVEASLLFACLPLVIAWLRAPLFLMLELMTDVFVRTWLPLLGFAITATLLLLFARFSMGSVLSLVPDTPAWTGMIRIFSALVLATVRSWLFLALVLTLLRHGFKAAASQERAN